MRPCSSRICPSCFGFRWVVTMWSYALRSLGRLTIGRVLVPSEAAGRTPARARIGRRRRPPLRPWCSGSNPAPGPVSGPAPDASSASSTGSSRGSASGSGPRWGQRSGPGSGTGEVGSQGWSAAGSFASPTSSANGSAGRSAVSASSPGGFVGRLRLRARGAAGAGRASRRSRSPRRPAPGRRSPGDPALGARGADATSAWIEGPPSRPRSRAAPRCRDRLSSAASSTCSMWSITRPGRAPGPATANPAYGARRT